MKANPKPATLLFIRKFCVPFALRSATQRLPSQGLEVKGLSLLLRMEKSYLTTGAGQGILECDPEEAVGASVGEQYVNGITFQGSR